MDRRRNGGARRSRTSLDMKSRHQKVSHEPTSGRQAAREEQYVGRCFPAGFPPTCRLASCALEFEVSGRKSHQRRWRRGDPTTEGSGRRIK